MCFAINVIPRQLFQMFFMITKKYIIIRQKERSKHLSFLIDMQTNNTVWNITTEILQEIKRS